MLGGPLSNTKKICAKPHENILSFSRQGKLDNGQKWALKYPNMALQSEGNNSYNFFCDRHSNSKNWFAEIHENISKLSQKIEKNLKICPLPPPQIIKSLKFSSDNGCQTQIGRTPLGSSSANCVLISMSKYSCFLNYHSNNL